MWFPAFPSPISLYWLPPSLVWCGTPHNFVTFETEGWHSLINTFGRFSTRFEFFFVWQCVIYAWQHTSTFFVSWYIYCNTSVCVHTRTLTTVSNLCVSISAWTQMYFLCLRIVSSKWAAVTIWLHAFYRNLVRVQRFHLFVVQHTPWLFPSRFWDWGCIYVD